MEKIRKINECPMCGGDVSALNPKSITDNKCPYCAYEIYNHSKEIYEGRIEDVKEAKSKLISTQMIIAIAAVLLVVIGGIFVLSRSVYRSTDQYHYDNSDKMTKKLQKAYEKEDWDTLFELTITDADKGLSSPYYFSYRSAWIMSNYVPAFDGAVESNDADRMRSAYDMIKNDYEYRSELAETFKLVPEIEEVLELEYERETKIMKERGLLD